MMKYLSTAAFVLAVSISPARAEEPPAEPQPGWTAEQHENAGFTHIACAGYFRWKSEQMVLAAGRSSSEEERKEFSQFADDLLLYRVGAQQLAGLHFHWAGYEDGYPGYSKYGEMDDAIHRAYLYARDLKPYDQHMLMLECNPVLKAAKRFCTSVGGDCWASP